MRKLRFMNDLKKIQWKDPLVVILCGLLVFLTIGSFFSGCGSRSQKSGIKVVIDAAKGNAWEGEVNEADATAAVKDELVSRLESDGRFIVYDAGSGSVADRVNEINKDNVDVVLSIRADGSPDQTKSGTYAYAQLPETKTHDASLKLAQDVISSFDEDKRTAQAGYLYFEELKDDVYNPVFVEAGQDTSDYDGKDTLELLEKCEVPAVSVNVLYVSNEDDVKTYGNEDGYSTLAKNLYRALCEYYSLGGKES